MIRPWRPPPFALPALFIMAALAATVSPDAAADELRVAVASNFREAMTAIVAEFEQESGQQVVVIFGSTGKHYAQIRNGAPFDAYFAADAERPRLLEQEGLAVPGTRFTYALGRLVLWSPQPELVDGAGRVLQQGGFRHLAIANPDLAPYGAAARSVLQALGAWERLGPRLVRGENIAQAFQFVYSGSAELGFVARSQLVVPGRDFGGSWWEPPAELYAPIVQQAVLLRDSAGGRSLFHFLRQPRVLNLLRTYGYDAP